MSDKVFYSENQRYGNIHRTLKANLLTYLPNDILDNLTDKYFRDKEGNLLCAYTGIVLDNINNVLNLEHIIPVSNGGGTILFNVVPSLKEINRAGEKSNNNLLDWWKNSEYYDISRLEIIVNYMLDGYEYCANQEGLFTFEVTESEEQNDTIKDEEYFNEMQKDEGQKEIIKKHDINTYKTFLNSLIIELENNKIDVSSFLERIKNLEKENVFEELDEQVMYQKVMLSLMRKYANNSKYKISSEVDYKKIIHNLGLDNIKDNFEVRLENFVMTLNEEKKVPISVHKSNAKLVSKIDKNTDSFIVKSNKLLNKIKNNKRVKDEDILKYELEKQIIKVFKKTSNKISFNLMMEYITEYPEILYDDSFDFEKLIKVHYKKYDRYADLIIRFCNEHNLFPRTQGDIKFQGTSEKTIYGYYCHHKNNFSKEKRDEIEQLKYLYQDRSNKKKTEDEIENYANIIIGFCNEYKLFPSVTGNKIYSGIDEKTINRYYKNYKGYFSDEKLSEIEILRHLYQKKPGDYNRLSQEQYDDYADLVIGFCKLYQDFPSQTGTKEYQGESETTIYNNYSSHKNKFSKEKHDEIEQLKDLYIREKYDKYANVIIGFCEEYKSFPSARGTLEYEGISEKAIYRYYKSHKDKFSKEKREEIEGLKELYQDTKYMKKTEDELEQYVDLIINFCNEYEKFPSVKGTKEYEGISEKKLYNYYYKHKDKFPKEKQEKLEKLRVLYQDTSNKKKTEDELEQYVDLIINFCNEYEKFPSAKGTKEYKGISEKIIYGYYKSHKDKFSKAKQEEIEQLKDLYQNKIGGQTLSQKEYDYYADIIIGFCNEYKKFPSQTGTKEYKEIKESTICGYYRNHKDNFSKAKREEIEMLKEKYQTRKRKKVINVENKLDDTKGKGR